MNVILCVVGVAALFVVEHATVAQASIDCTAPSTDPCPVLNNTAYLLQGCTTSVEFVINQAVANVSFLVVEGSVLPSILVKGTVSFSVVNVNITVVRCNVNITTTSAWQPLLYAPAPPAHGGYRLYRVTIAILDSIVHLRNPHLLSQIGADWGLVLMDVSEMSSCSISMINSRLEVTAVQPMTAFAITQWRGRLDGLSFLCANSVVILRALCVETPYCVAFPTGIVIKIALLHFVLYNMTASRTSLVVQDSVLDLQLSFHTSTGGDGHIAEAFGIAFFSYSRQELAHLRDVVILMRNVSADLNATMAATLISIGKINTGINVFVDVRDVRCTLSTAQAVLSHIEAEAKVCTVVTVTMPVFTTGLSIALFNVHVEVTMLAGAFVVTGIADTLVRYTFSAVYLSSPVLEHLDVTVHNATFLVNQTAGFATTLASVQPLSMILQLLYSTVVTVVDNATLHNGSVVIERTVLDATSSITIATPNTLLTGVAILHALLSVSANTTSAANIAIAGCKLASTQSVLFTVAQSPSQTCAFVAQLVSFVNPQQLSFDRMAALLPLIATMFAVETPPTVLVHTTVRVAQSELLVRGGTTLMPLGGERHCALAALPTVSSATSLVVANATISVPVDNPPDVHGLLCLASCGLSNTSTVALRVLHGGLLHGPVIHVVRLKRSSVPFSMTVSDSTLELLGLRCDAGPAGPPSVWGATQLVFFGGASQLAIDGCTFYRYSSLFPDETVHSTTANPAIVVGCNQFSPIASASATVLLPLSIRDVGSLLRSDLEFAGGPSPFLPAGVVCGGDAATVTSTFPEEDVPMAVDTPAALIETTTTTVFAVGVGASVVLGSTAALLDAQVLLAIAQSPCAPAAVRSTTASSKSMLVSPFASLGSVWIVFGNTVLASAFFGLHVLARRLIAYWQRTTEPPTPRGAFQLRPRINAADAKAKFPNLSITVATMLLTGIVGETPALLADVGDALSVVTGVWGLIVVSLYALAWRHLDRLVDRRFRFIPYTPHTVRKVFPEMSKGRAELVHRLLPAGVWSPAHLRATHGRLRGAVRRGRERFAAYPILVTAAVAFAAGVPVPQDFCIGWWPVLTAIPLIAAAMIVLCRPNRSRTAGSFHTAALLIAANVSFCGFLLRTDVGSGAEPALPALVLAGAAVSMLRGLHSLLTWALERRLGQHPETPFPLAQPKPGCTSRQARKPTKVMLFQQEQLRILIETVCSRR